METTCDSPPESPPNKRLKTLTESPIPSPSNSKGKSKIESSPDEDAIANESTDCCGICFSEAVIGAGGVSRGFIDSCNHYFCFVCIMEWAKVESKCPLCKRRFSSIRRPAKPPVFPSERVVRIPVRDQIYNGIGNATLGPPDPYSEVTCSVCHSVANENLLLLCDLCDTASHTYCIGLGHTVPEGDWFCQDCTLLKDESLTSDINTEPTFQLRLQKDQTLSSADQNISISDIVREPCRNAYQRTRSASSYPSHLPPSSTTNAETSTTNNINTANSRIGESDTQHPTISTARTLRRCHDVHDRIHVLRKRWNDYQNGSLGFSSGRPDTITSSHSVSSVNGQNQASRSNQQLTPRCSSSNNVKRGTGEDEVLKAWKMLDRAKLMKKSLAKSEIANQSPKYPAKKLNATNDANDLSHRLLHRNSQNFGSKDSCNGGPEKLYSRPLTTEYRSQKPSVCGKREYESPTNKTINYLYKGSVPVYMPAKVQPAAAKFVQIPTYQCNASILNSKSQSAEKSSEEPVCVTISSVMPEPTKGHTKDISSSSKEKHPKEKSQLDRTCAVRSKQYNDARSEILSLVKLNLKFQTKGEKLEVNAYKEVARLATHSILAACGLEKQKPGYSSIPGSICSHPSESRQPRTASLMPDSCRECFYEFTKNMVVNIITLHKKRTENKKNSVLLSSS